MALQAGQELNDVVRVLVVLLAVDYRWYKVFFGSAIGYCPTPPLSFLQVIWHHRGGILPWQSGGEDLLAYQPHLSLHPGEPLAGVWSQEL